MTESISRRLLGSTGLKVSELGLGAWAIGGKHYGAVDKNTAKETIRSYIDSGGNFIDTAPSYGESEYLIGETLANIKDDIVVLSKTPSTRSGHEIEDIDRDIETTLTRLRRDYLDIYLMHNPPCDPSVRNLVIHKLEALRDRGLIREIGASIAGPSVTEDTVAMCHEYIGTGRVSVIEVIISPLRQLMVHEGITDRCAEAGVGVIARTALESGFLSGKYPASHQFPEDDHRSRWSENSRRAIDLALEDLERIRSSTAGAPETLIELGSRFPLAYRGVSSVILGAKSPEQLWNNITSGSKGPLSATLQHRVERWGRGRTLQFNPEGFVRI